MIKLLSNFLKLFKKEEEFDPHKKFKCKVYSKRTGQFLGMIEVDYNEYKERVTFDTTFRYSRVEDGD